MGLAGIFLWRSRRKAPVPAPIRKRWASRGAAVARTAAVALVAGGCGNGSKGGGGGDDAGGGSTCLAGQTACGTQCVDLTTAVQHCGACDHACAPGFACSGASCAFPTGNPFLRSVDPTAVGRGSQPALRVAGEGLQPGAVMRLKGAACTSPCGPPPAPPTEPGCCVEVPLQVGSGTSGAVPAVDLSGMGMGVAEVRVLNPGRLVSNGVPLSVVDALGLRGVSPAGMRQDQAGAVDLTLTGYGFLAGIAATLRTPGGALQALPTTYVSATEARATGVSPATLAVGQYDVMVSNPGTPASNALKLSVTEGAPVLSAITPTCVVPSPVFAGAVTGSFLYPSSVVRVTGNSIADSPLATSCMSGTDALGRCVGGLRVVADLTGVPPGTYDVTVVNPGLLRSAAQTIQLKASCP
jgi:hypothetical protein